MFGKPGPPKVGRQMGHVIGDHDRRWTFELVPDDSQSGVALVRGKQRQAGASNACRTSHPIVKAWVMTTSTGSRPSTAAPASRSIALAPRAAPWDASSSETSARNDRTVSAQPSGT